MLKTGERTRKRPLTGKVRTFWLNTTSSEGCSKDTTWVRVKVRGGGELGWSLQRWHT